MKSIFPLIAAVSLLFFSCTNKESIKVAGSSTVLPVVSVAAERYVSANPELNILVNAGGSGVGVNQLGEGKIDIGMISRDINEDEISRYTNCTFKVHAIAIDAVVPVISSEIYNAGITSLSLAQIAAIYTGEVTNWKSFGGPDKEILCIDKEKSRGTRQVFMEIVLGNAKADANGADLILGSNNEEQTALVQSDAAIGMLSNAWLNDDVKGLSIRMNDSLTVEPTIENIKNGTFPFVRNIQVITNGEPTGQVKEFIDYLLSEAGQRIATEAGYVSITK